MRSASARRRGWRSNELVRAVSRSDRGQLSTGAAASQTKWLLAVIAGQHEPAAPEIADRFGSEMLAVRTAEQWRDALVTVAQSLRRALIHTIEVEHEYLVRLVLSTLEGPLVRFSCRTELATGKVSAFGLGRPFRDVTWTDELIDVDGGQLRVRDYGGDGPASVLLHCGLLDVSHWDLPSRNLAGRRVAIDLRSHGAWPVSGPLLVADVAHDIGAVAQHLQLGPLSLVGHSLGGWVALACAARHGVAERLVTFDGPYGLSRTPGTPTPSDAPEWTATEQGDAFRTVEDIASLDAPWLAILCETSDGRGDSRGALAAHITERRRDDWRVVWEPARHDELVMSPRALDVAARWVRQEE